MTGSIYVLLWFNAKAKKDKIRIEDVLRVNGYRSSCSVMALYLFVSEWLDLLFGVLDDLFFIAHAPIPVGD